MSEQAGLLDALRRAVDALNRHGGKYALVGAVAVGARSEPRFTRDIDLAVAVANHQEAERLIGRLPRDGYELRQLFQREVSEEIVTARLIHPSAPDVFTDLLFRTSGIEAEVVAGGAGVISCPSADRTNGSIMQSRDRVSDECAESCDVGEGVHVGQHVGEIDADLAGVVAVWQRLPAWVRRAIRALIESVGGGS